MYKSRSPTVSLGQGEDGRQALDDAGQPDARPRALPAEEPLEGGGAGVALERQDDRHALRPVPGRPSHLGNVMLGLASFQLPTCCASLHSVDGTPTTTTSAMSLSMYMVVM